MQNETPKRRKSKKLTAEQSLHIFQMFLNTDDQDLEKTYVRILQKNNPAGMTRLVKAIKGK